MFGFLPLTLATSNGTDIAIERLLQPQTQPVQQPAALIHLDSVAETAQAVPIAFKDTSLKTLSMWTVQQQVHPHGNMIYRLAANTS